MLLLTAKVIQLNGQASDAITVEVGAGGGSVGRDESCTLVLPERWVSRVQARITQAQGRYVLHNASVSNPMYVNAIELAPGASEVIADGDQWQVGSYVIEAAEVQDGQHVARAVAAPDAGAKEEAGSAHPCADLLAPATVAEQQIEAPLPPDEDRPSSLTAQALAPSAPSDNDTSMSEPVPDTPWPAPAPVQPVTASPFEPLSQPDEASIEPYAAPLSALAGDPFADLMGRSVESHLAQAPAPASSAPAMTLIPEDFNPFAGGGVAQRNAADPLTTLGRNNQGLAEVQPSQTVDSIYHPGAESMTALVVDPLASSHERALRIGQDTDPLKLFDGQGQAQDIMDLGKLTNVRSVPDHALEMTSYFRAPAALPDPAMAAEPLMGHADTPAAAAPPPAPAKAPASPAAPTTAPAPTAGPAPEAPAATIATAAGQPLAPAAPQAPPRLEHDGALPPEPVPARLPMAPAAVEPIAEEPAPAGATEQTLLSAFKQGAGLQDWAAPSLTPQLMQTLGRLLQSATQGVVSLLAARAAVKQEIHLSVTLMNPQANNPLKFLPDGHTALLQMLGPRAPGFMPPIEAMQEAFEDLVTHQTAIAAGTQAALEALFLRFDPSAIESQHPQAGVSEKISQTLHGARLWQAYKNHYRLIKDEVQDDFFRRLGVEFHEAYHREYGHDGNA